MRFLFVLLLAYFAYTWFTKPNALHSSATTHVRSVTKKEPNVQLILRDVNQYRAKHGLKPLRYSKTCQVAARIQAQYNADHGTFHHDNTELPTPGDRLRVANHRYLGASPYWAENAFRYTLGRDLKHGAVWHVFHCYHISPPHDATMRNPKVTRFGTATVVDADGVMYNAQVFSN